MSTNQILPTDNVIARLSLRARDKADPVEVRINTTVADLGLKEGGKTAGGEPPTLDNDAWRQALVDGDMAKAERLMADFHAASATFVAGGGETPAESLASALVRWMVEKRPGGHTFTTNTEAETGLIVNEGELNIAGPHEVDGERFFRVTAVATWGG